MKIALAICACCLASVHATLEVNSLADTASPPEGTVTLRSALARAAADEPIIFAPALDGEVISLSIVAEEHTVLFGEVMLFDYVNNISELIGYYERDYGRSALYSTKHVNIDASALPHGITIAWGGGDVDPARVLAVRGNLTMKNVSVTGGRSVAETIPEPSGEYPQLSTRARGGGLAVWGVATLEHCRLFDNTCIMPSTVYDPGRDTGVFGGGIYADIVYISDCIISGNSLSGAGVSGGGVFSVGGAHASPETARIERTTVTGNRIDGIYAYGAGVYSDGGGIGNLKTFELENCTIAGNRVGVSGPSFLYGSGYWRGGGVYMSNGYLIIRSCTIVENEVHGVPRTNELGKPNLAGGVAATIGNAHAVESMTIGQSIITGNTVHESTGRVYNHDIFTGSLFEFFSEGHNRLGVIDFSQMLVPVGYYSWWSLCRKHYPKQNDQNGVNITNVLDLAEGIAHSHDILSTGVNASNAVALFYLPKGSAIEQVPENSYTIENTTAQYHLSGSSDNFPEIMLGRLEQLYGITNFASSFTVDFENFLSTVDIDEETEGNQPYVDPGETPILTLAATKWFYVNQIWPSKLYNYPYIEFWHRLDIALQNENIPGMGPELLGDDAWLALFDAGQLEENTSFTMSMKTETYEVAPTLLDQTGAERPADEQADIGAMEAPHYIPPPPWLDGIELDGTNIVLHWNGATNRSFTLWAATSLLDPDWNSVESGLTNNIPVIVQPVQAPQSGQFFKIEMDPLP
ncbi:right-handed parallel beta-helix repeat-containing protein [Pontiellaceae bacterium B1224]|nr:right-handed parallel beta-helix repeat-containing protein [Pontiellaceae bacterium B1224]